ncbi:eCIS core domain-containing protein [Aquimarina agarivorans]|uniref:eCIS core domain-containing protein n=1 Tax=Aquimarina agarivorans TaxID=980584 RepID=UPI000248F2C9|nr:DUF4157 domain-containing protein [Aquimarina agarivorans]
MKTIFATKRNKLPHDNKGKERNENSFFGEAKRQPFFNGINRAAGIQTKLTVGKPGDKYEKEADSMADAVVNNSAKPAIQNKEISSIQRESLATPQEDEKLGTAEQRIEQDKLVQEKPEIQCMEEDEVIQKLEDEEAVLAKEQEADDKMQLKEEAVLAKIGTKRLNTANKEISSKLKNKAGKGGKMDAKTKRSMEASFGKDFSNVNIHTDQDAVALNKELGAQAFTQGKDVYFNSSKYKPESVQGKYLLAHELTHVVQQNELGKGYNDQVKN